MSRSESIFWKVFLGRELIRIKILKGVVTETCGEANVVTGSCGVAGVVTDICGVTGIVIGSCGLAGAATALWAESAF